MNKEIKQPTLREAVEHMKKHGGHLKGRGNGKIEWRNDEN